MKYQIYYGTEPIKQLFDSLEEAENDMSILVQEDYLNGEESYKYYSEFYTIKEVAE